MTKVSGGVKTVTTKTSSTRTYRDPTAGLIRAPHDQPYQKLVWCHQLLCRHQNALHDHRNDDDAMLIMRLPMTDHHHNALQDQPDQQLVWSHQLLCRHHNALNDHGNDDAMQITTLLMTDHHHNALHNQPYQQLVWSHQLLCRHHIGLQGHPLQCRQ